jgi:hypothetical protein
MIYDLVGLVKSKTTSMLKTERREKNQQETIDGCENQNTFPH